MPQGEQIGFHFVWGFFWGGTSYHLGAPQDVIEGSGMLVYLSYKTLLDSVKTVIKNYTQRPKIYNDRGWKILNEFEYYNIPQKNRTAYLQKKVQNNEYDDTRKFTLDHKKLILFENIVEYCEVNDIGIHVYFNPVYYKLYKSMHTNQNISEIKLLKKEILKITSFYDFSGINFITKNYQNFWDGSHANQQISKYILDSIFLNKQYKDFGVFLEKK